MIEAQNLSKHYGPKTAVDDVSFTVRPGVVTGFLGPNGAGKSTTMRMIVGLDRPSAGSVEVNGQPYHKHKAPLLEVGALLEARAVHPGRSAYQHLKALAATHNIPRQQVDKVIELTGLDSVAKKRVGGFSLGMGQRLGTAVALLGDPRTLILDEPVNGLDPDGVLWVRHLVRELASRGKTVFLSSHLMSEMTQTADHLLVIGRGKILADAPINQVLAGVGGSYIQVRTQDPDRLTTLLTGQGGQVTADAERLDVNGLDQQTIAKIALDEQILVYELTPVTGTLEQAYLGLTREEVEFESHDLEAATQEGATA